MNKQQARVEMSKLELRAPEPLDFDDAGKAWPMWKQKFKVFLIASGKNKEDEKTKISLFLLYIGDKGIEVYNTLFDEPFDPDEEEVEFQDAVSEEEDDEEQEEKASETTKQPITLKLVIAKFEEYCLPKKNLVMENSI